MLVSLCRNRGTRKGIYSGPQRGINGNSNTARGRDYTTSHSQKEKQTKPARTAAVRYGMERYARNPPKQPASPLTIYLGAALEMVRSVASR